MKKLEDFMMSKWFLPALIAVMLLVGLLCQLQCSGQTVFTNTSKPVSFGTVTATDELTVMFTYTSDTGSNKFRSSTFFELGNVKAYVGYPYIVFNSGVDVWQVLMTGSIGYSRIHNRKPHKLTFRIGEGKKEILVDSFIIASKNYSVPVNQNATLWFSTNSSIDKLSGTVSDVAAYPDYVLLKKELAMPAGEQDVRNLPPNYTTGQWENVADVIDQLRAMPSPKYVNSMPKIRPLFNYRNLGGWLDSTIPKDTAIKRAVEIASLMCEKFNCTLLMIDNTQDLWDYYVQPNSPNNKYNMAMCSLANAHPEWEIEIGFALAQIHDSRNGWKVVTTAQRNAMMPNEPYTTFEGNRQVVKEQLQLVQSLITRPINYIFWDNEFYNDFLDTVKYQNNNACREAKELSGMSWWDYCSYQYTQDVIYTFQDFSSLSPQSQLSEYDVNGLDACNQYYFAKYKYRSKMNTNDWGSGQVYPCSNRAAFYGYSTFRGFMNYTQVDLKAYYAQTNYRFTPFLQPGSQGQPEITMTPTFATGLATLLFGAGAYSIHPSVFYDLGLSPNPKALAWQLAYCSYAQASFSKHPDIVLKGKLVNGDHSMGWSCFGSNDYTFWTGDKETVAEVMQYGNECFITVTRGFLSNFKPSFNAGYKSQGTGIWFNNKYIPLSGRNQGSVYYYRIDLPLSSENPKLENGFVKFGDPQNWDAPAMEGVE